MPRDGSCDGYCDIECNWLCSASENGKAGSLGMLDLHARAACMMFRSDSCTMPPVCCDWLPLPSGEDMYCPWSTRAGVCADV